MCRTSALLLLLIPVLCNAVSLPIGHMDGCVTFKQSETFLFDIHASFPDVTDRFAIGVTGEGRNITTLCVGIKCKSTEPAPQVVFVYKYIAKLY